MTAEEPEIGLVIRHVYLWQNEALRGHEEGRKVRPCVIIHKRRNANGRTEVYIALVTYTKPRDLSKAKEIPLETKERLGLDHERSWIIFELSQEYAHLEGLHWWPEQHGYCRC